MKMITCGYSGNDKSCVVMCMQVHVLVYINMTWELLTTSTLVYHMMSMVEEKTIVFSSIVAEKVIAITAVPYSLVANVIVIVAVVASSSLLCSPYRKVRLTETFDGCRE